MHSVHCSGGHEGIFPQSRPYFKENCLQHMPEILRKTNFFLTTGVAISPTYFRHQLAELHSLLKGCVQAVPRPIASFELSQAGLKDP